MSEDIAPFIQRTIPPIFIHQTANVKLVALKGNEAATSLAQRTHTEEGQKQIRLKNFCKFPKFSLLGNVSQQTNVHIDN